MSEQITFYHDVLKMSPFCHRVEIALLETGAPFRSHGLDIYSKPEWFTKVNPMTGKIPVITYGGPDAPPEDPSPESIKITESFVLLEFLADVFPNSTLLPPASDPVARARVRFFVDVFRRDVEGPALEVGSGVPGAFEKLIQGLEKLQSLLPDADAAGGEYVVGSVFTIADCAMAPLLAGIEMGARTDLWMFQTGMGKKLGEIVESPKFERLRRYRDAVRKRESVQKVLDLDRMEVVWRQLFSRKPE